MSKLKRSALSVMIAAGMVLALATAAHAGEVKHAKAGGKKAAPVYAVEQPLPGARVESVLTDPRTAVTTAREQPGWLLHYGKKWDTCARPDATSGSRMMCVAW